MIKKKKKWNWAAIIISFILISSTFAITFYGLTSDTDVIRRYKDYKFARTLNGWQTEINDKQVFFNYLPQEVENIEIERTIADGLRLTPEIDVTSAINDTNADAIALAEVEMEQILAELSFIYVRKGFDTNTSHLPIITCNESNVPVIYFRTGLNTSITFDKCIIAEGATGQDMLRLKDRIIYAMYGIIP